MAQAHSPNKAATVAKPGPESEINTLHRSCGIYTKPEIVRRILDAVGWTQEEDLSRARLLEPAAGNGEFVVEAGRRLVESYRTHGIEISAVSLKEKISAFELHGGAIDEARSRTNRALLELGIKVGTATACVNAWFSNADYLLEAHCQRGFTHAVGNPPYIRWSKIPERLKATYTDRLPQGMIGGDLFLPFLDKTLEQLSPAGRFGFICSDRWRYMAFAEEFRKKWLPAMDVISEHSLPAREAFVSDVDTYPTILIASKRRTRVPNTTKSSIGNGTTLKEQGYSVRVGPALGFSSAFVLEPHEDDVEAELLQPWFDSSEIAEGVISWRGRRVITLYDNEGNLVALEKFPMLATRLGKFARKLRQRYIVRNGAVWYRTIDRVRAQDWSRPKLVVPDIAKTPRLAIDHSGAIPSHGVYAIFAPNDDVDALYDKLRDGGLAQALLGISPKVKGGYLRCYKRFLLNAQIPKD